MVCSSMFTSVHSDLLECENKLCDLKMPKLQTQAC